MLSVVDIHKSYGEKKALAGLSFDIGEKEIYGLLGPNGAGKSTFMKILMGFTEKGSGEINFSGSLVKTLSREQFGYLPEKIAIPPFLKGKEFLEYSCRFYKNGNEYKQNIANILKRLDFTSQAEQKTGGYSKGMMQKIGLARALLNSPRLIILDEPASGLDPDATHRLKEIISEEREKGNSVILSSHRLAEVEHICDRIGIIHNGIMKTSGYLADLRKGISEVTVELWNPSGEQLNKLEMFLNEKYSFAKKGRTWTVKFNEGEDIRNLPSEIVGLGAELGKFERRSESLEELFLRVTNG